MSGIEKEFCFGCVEYKVLHIHIEVLSWQMKIELIERKVLEDHLDIS